MKLTGIFVFLLPVCYPAAELSITLSLKNEKQQWHFMDLN